MTAHDERLGTLRVRRIGDDGWAVSWSPDRGGSPRAVTGSHYQLFDALADWGFPPEVIAQVFGQMKENVA